MAALQEAEVLIEYVEPVPTHKPEYVRGSGLWKLSNQQRAVYEGMNAMGIKNDTPVAIDDRTELVKRIVELEDKFSSIVGDLPINEEGTQKICLTPEDTEGLTCDVTIYLPEGVEEPLPGLVRIHGGGMTMFSGKEAMFEIGDRELAKLGIAVCAVHFTNSHVEAFPRGLNDCVNAAQWFASAETKERFNLIRDKGVALYGESGGGNLSITTAMSLKGTDTISCLCALAPYTNGEAEKYPDIAKSYTEMQYDLPEYQQYLENMGNMLLYLYTPEGSEDITNPLAWPYHANEEDVKELCPTLIMINECDGIRDQGYVMYHKLQKAGVTSNLIEYAGTGHCHMGEPVIQTLMFKTLVDYIKYYTLQ